MGLVSDEVATDLRPGRFGLSWFLGAIDAPVGRLMILRLPLLTPFNKHVLYEPLFVVVVGV